jgi:porphobilinogen synthase
MQSDLRTTLKMEDARLQDAHQPLIIRPRRLRRTNTLRSMVRETEINPRDFIYPLFVRPGTNIQAEISSMPGVYQWSVDRLSFEAEAIARLDIPAVILFGIPHDKDPVGLENFAPHGIVQEAIRAIKMLSRNWWWSPMFACVNIPITAIAGY